MRDGSVWRPENYAQDFYGPQTLRTRHRERSRNVMTVRLAQDLGMPLVAEYAKMFGIYDKLNAACWRWRWAPAKPPTCG